MELKPVETITAEEAGRLIHKNAEFIRAGLRQNRFNFGSAIKGKGNQWSYNIIKNKFYEYAGIKEESTNENS